MQMELESNAGPFAEQSCGPALVLIRSASKRPVREYAPRSTAISRHCGTVAVRNAEDNNVEDDCGIFRKNFDRLDVAVLTQSSRHFKFRVRVWSHCRHPNARSCEDKIRSAYPPSTGWGPLDWSRRVDEIAFWRVAIHPLRDRRKL